MAEVMLSAEHVLELLEEVKDPEIPSVSVVDLGIITGINVLDDHHADVMMTPTFVGCPAIEVMKNDVHHCLQSHGIQANVQVNFDIPWDSNRVTEKGRAALKKFGLAPPPKYDLVLDLDILHQVACPYCDSMNTVLHNPFGPTLCRSIHYCNNCMQAFEQFKPV
jgi:ring-1,2-phenylacetyl-CoA epoxidase subunit PaaD